SRSNGTAQAIDTKGKPRCRAISPAAGSIWSATKASTASSRRIAGTCLQALSVRAAESETVRRIPTAPFGLAARLTTSAVDLPGGDGKVAIGTVRDRNA